MSKMLFTNEIAFLLCETDECKFLSKEILSFGFLLLQLLYIPNLLDLVEYKSANRGKSFTLCLTKT